MWTLTSVEPPLFASPLNPHVSILILTLAKMTHALNAPEEERTPFPLLPTTLTAPSLSPTPTTTLPTAPLSEAGPTALRTVSSFPTLLATATPEMSSSHAPPPAPLVTTGELDPDLRSAALTLPSDTILFPATPTRNVSLENATTFLVVFAPLVALVLTASWLALPLLWSTLLLLSSFLLFSLSSLLCKWRRIYHEGAGFPLTLFSFNEGKKEEKDIQTVVQKKKIK